VRWSDALPFVLAFFVIKSARKMITPAPAPASARVVPRKNTGGGATYRPARIAALAAHGITGDVAEAIFAQWAFETAYGRGEWNFNVGNRIALAGDPAVDLGKAGYFKAYDTLDAGVAEYLTLVQSSRYAQAWTMLHAAPRSSAWIRQLVLSGYADKTHVDAYEAGYLRMLHYRPEA